ncbi:MAG TPA: hypothetical protein VHO47_05460 [Candidatus Babeliales bacterium]|nr:hypothetical protein [Candidatus Babeliales bacterium]
MKKIILILLSLFVQAYSIEKKPDTIGFGKILKEVIASRGSNLVYSMVIHEHCDLYSNPEKTIKNPDAKKYFDDLILLEGDKISAQARVKINYNPEIKPGHWEAWKIDVHLNEIVENEIQEKIKQNK